MRARAHMFSECTHTLSISESCSPMECGSVHITGTSFTTCLVTHTTEYILPGNVDVDTIANPCGATYIIGRSKDHILINTGNYVQCTVVLF